MNHIQLEALWKDLCVRSIQNFDTDNLIILLNISYDIVGYPSIHDLMFFLIKPYIQ